MSIQKRTGADGKPRYRVQIAVTDPTTGKRRNVAAGTYRTRKEAEAAEREAIQRRDRGTLLDPSTAAVGQLLDEWLVGMTGRVSTQTIADYEITCRKHLKPAFGAVKVQKLTADAIGMQYRAWQDAGKTPRFIRGAHLRLSQAMAYAVARGIIYVNPLATVKPPALATKKADVWNAEEARRFLDTAMARPVLHRGGDSGQRKPDDLSPLWHLLLMEGMRRGEALGLRWADITWERGTAHIVQTVTHDKRRRQDGETGTRTLIQDRAKTKASARTVRLTVETLAVLKEHRKAQLAERLRSPEWQDHDLIVCTSHGTPVNPANVTRSFTALVKAAGLRRIRVHDLRHTHATLLLKAGVHPKIVSERLGHASIAITLDTYSHVLPDSQDAAADAISAALAGNRTGTAG